jgi:glucosamine--fructose-6-phosphate aminotransferase (isomerizing)
MTATEDGDSVARQDALAAPAISPYERDIEEQPRALREFIAAPRAELIASRPLLEYERVLLTGMGSSHAAAARTWRRLVAGGSAAWWVDTAALLESPQLITADTLLIITSQSGASGETVALFDAVSALSAEPEVIGITNDEGSPLARGSDHVILLNSGEEATVSTKSYVNSLAAHEYLATALLGGASAALREDLLAGIDALQELGEIDDETVARAATPDARVAFIGSGDQVATALFGGLVLKEAAKVPAEGFLAGNFRHGPLEIAGPGLVAFVLGVAPGEAGAPLSRLAADIASSGSEVVTFGSASVPGCRAVTATAYEGFAGLVAGAQLCHRLCVPLARARGVAPGEFRFGQKVTGL